MNIKKILEITIKDLKGYFDGMYGYILIFIFLSVSYFIFIQSFFLMGVASLFNLFDYIPMYMIVFIPAITMGSFSRELDKQTIEIILTKPVQILDTIIGKLLSAIVFAMTAILLTTPLIYAVAKTGRVDLGETLGGYLSVFLLIVSLSSIGVAVSSFFKNQISAFLISCFIIFVLYLTGTSLTTTNIPTEIANLISSIGLMPYYQSLTRGVADLGDIIYFLLITIISIAIANLNLHKYKISNFNTFLNRSIMIIFSTVFIAFWMIYVLRSYDYRFDLTQSKKYTLSGATKDVLRNEGKLNITVYVSKNLPQQFQFQLSEIKNTLNDYKRLGGNKVDIQYVDPEGKEGELTTEGIQPVQFNVIGNDQFEAKQGYFALIVKNEAGDKKEVIPYINDISNFEYQLTRLIYKVKSTTTNKLLIASGNGEYSQFDEFSNLGQLLGDNFAVDSLYIPGEDVAGTKTDKSKQDTDLKFDGATTLLIANPTTKYTKKSIDQIKDFLNNGGKVIYTIDSVNIGENAQVVPPEEGKAPQGDLFADLGIKISNNLAYDLKSYQTVTAGTQTGVPIRLPYPLFPILERKEEVISFSPEKLDSVWPSSLEISQDGWKVMYQTSSRGGVITSNFTTDPQQKFSQDNLKQYPIVAYREFDKGGKMVVIGNARLLSNNFLGDSQTNSVFALSLSESFGTNTRLSEIKAKDLFNTKFNSNLDNKVKNWVRFGAPTLSFVLLTLIGAYRIIRKKMLIGKIESSIN